MEQLVPDGYVVAEAPLPALVTVSNELGAPRYPTMRNIMAANRKRPTLWKATDLALDPAVLTPRIELVELCVPVAYAAMRDHRRGRCGRGWEKSGAETARSQVDLKTEWERYKGWQKHGECWSLAK